MNFKVRLKNPVFWVQLVVIVISTILAASGASWEQMTSWPTLFHLIGNAVQNPVTVVAIIAAIWGILNDPTTSGISDSTKALTYKTPNKD